jgi:quercetin dioxygenase-like cupin family protein
MKTINRSSLTVLVALLLLPAFQAMAQEGNKLADETTIFPKGEKIENDNFTGIAWVSFLARGDSTNQTSVGNVTFEPGARTNWHSHPAGQILLATGGVGYYQEKGSSKKILRKGDVVKCPPNVPHWHGASSDQEFVHVAITGREKGPTEWLEPVTDGEYSQ